MTRQVWPMVVQDMLARNEEGAKKYNRYLQTDCPDDMLQHAYEEALDLCVYLKTQIEKQNNTRREALQKEKEEWILKNIKNGQSPQQSTPVQENMDLMKQFTSPLDWAMKPESSREKSRKSSGETQYILMI